MKTMNLSELTAENAKEDLEMNMPGFTAEASLYHGRNVGYRYSDGFISSPGQRVVPQLPMQRGGKFTCAANSSSFCEFLCDWLGGGMVSNPNGTVSCYY